MDDILLTTFLNTFLEWKYMNFDYDFIDVCSLGSNYQYSSSGSDNGLEPTRRQLVIWTNGGKFTDVYLRHSASMNLNFVHSLNNIIGNLRSFSNPYF